MEKDYFGGLGSQEPKPAAEKKAIGAKKDEPTGKQLTIHVSTKGGKILSSIDHHDGLPADEMQHDSPEDAGQAHVSAMQQEFADGDADDQKSTPRPSHGAGDYMSKMREME